MQRSEAELEKYFIDQLTKVGWKYIEGKTLPRVGAEEQLLIPILSDKLKQLNKNKNISDDDVDKVITELKLTATGIEGSKKLLRYYKQGVPVKFEKEKIVKLALLSDFENITNNTFIVSNQVTHTGLQNIRNDIILYINGIPLVNIELKDPTNPAESWENAYYQIKDYENSVRELYKYVQIGVASNGTARYFPIVPWQREVKTYQWKHDEMDSLDATIHMLSTANLLDILKYYFFIREEHAEVTKVIARYMQQRAVEKIVTRVRKYSKGEDEKNKGLIWHWQGSGKTFEIISAANKLMFLPELENPTIFIIVDRDDLQTQLQQEYDALDIYKARIIGSINKLKEIILADNFRGKRGVFIVLIHKFNPNEFDEVNKIIEEQAGETISTRKNVICLIDEGHRSQYGLLAAQMRKLLKNAFYFAFTGTPIAKKGRNTYLEFGFTEDEPYLDEYFITKSIADGFTKKITYKPRLDKLHLEKEKLEAFLQFEFEEIPEEFRENIKDEIRQRLNPVNLFLEDNKRIEPIAEDIANHFRNNVEGNYKAIVVAASRKACVRYKHALDKFLPSSYSEIIMTYNPTKDPGVPELYNYFQNLIKAHHGMEIEQIRKKIIEDYKEEENPKILIVTDMLLTGFDAPVLQTMYLDKPLKEQRLLQAIARTNRPYAEKESGLIIDYVGIFDRIEKAFEIYAEQDISSAILNTANLNEEFVELIENTLKRFNSIPKDYNINTLQDALEIIISDKSVEDTFIINCKKLQRLYEFLGSAEIKLEYLKEYKWLIAVYSYYKKIVLRDDKYRYYLNKYFKKTLELIHQETEVQELVESPVKVVIDEDFISEIQEKVDNKNVAASNLVFALNRFVLVDQHKNPIYESLITRVEALVNKWRERVKENADITEVLNDAQKISNEIISLQSKQKELGLSDVQMATWLTIKTNLDIATDEKLLEEMKELFEELSDVMIPGWTKNAELRKSVETKLRQFIFTKIRPKYPIPLEKVNDIHKSVGEKLIGYESKL